MQSDCSDKALFSFIKDLGFGKFSKELVKTAFTHSSYTKENGLEYNKCYERLEFLGDAVLKMAVTDYLYEKYPESHEGELTKIRSIVISDEILYKIAQTINIEPYIIVSQAEEKCGGTKLESIQACVMEALFGALYLSSDRNKLKEFIIKNLIQIIEDIKNNKTVYNAKAILQEYTQSKSKELPQYEIVDEKGKAHNKTFYVAVSYNGKTLAQAEGKTKKQAQQEAAYAACVKLGLIKGESETNE